MEKSLKTNISNQKETNILGYEKIGNLVRIYAMPSIISMLVNALYNFVNQVSIGQGIGYLGTEATNIIFPLTIAFNLFSLMLDDEASAYLSLQFGEGKRD